MTEHPDGFRDWESAYVLGMLAPSDRRAFEHHLASCMSCAVDVADLAGMPGALSALSAAEAVALTLPSHNEHCSPGRVSPIL